MFTAQQIRPDMNVIDTEGRKVGIVEHVQDDMVGLTREGFADDLHHFVPLAAVMRMDADTLVVEHGHATTVEAVTGAIQYARRHSAVIAGGGPVFGTTGFGTGDGGPGMGT